MHLRVVLAAAKRGLDAPRRGMLTLTLALTRTRTLALTPTLTLTLTLMRHIGVRLWVRVSMRVMLGLGSRLGVERGPYASRRGNPHPYPQP